MNAAIRSGWIVPWLVSALATLHLSLVWPASIPALGSLFLLAWTVVRRRPLAIARWIPWLLAAPFALWWVRLSVTKEPRPDELLSIVSWYLAVLSSIQVLAGSRSGGWRTWNATSAVLLAGFRPDLPQTALVVVLFLLVLVQSRVDAEHVGSTRFRPAWIAAVAAVALLAFAARSIDLPVSFQGFERWKPPNRAKGFSSTLRLGGGFGLDPDPSDDDVVLRLWTDRPPRYLKGAVFDVYSRGHWSRSEGWSGVTSSRVELEYSVYCHVSDTMAPPSGLAIPSESTEGYLLVPPASGCVGVVADTILRTGSGLWRVPDGGLGRGWMWFPGAIPERVRESERALPHDQEGVIDSVLERIGAAGLPPLEALARIRAWLDRGFAYSLQPLERPGEDPLRTFLRERRGYCEHYATLGALLARGCGIPSRVATGYAYPEPSAGAWLLRRSNAHAWVELFLPGRGWVTWDPTPGDVLPSAPRGILRRWSDALGTRLAAVWHVVRDGGWRIALSDRIEASIRGIGAVWGLLPVAMLLAWVVARRIRARKDGVSRTDARRWREVLAKAEARLRRDGIVREPGETVGAFLARLPGDAHAQSRRLLESYQRKRWIASGAGDDESAGSFGEKKVF